MPERNNQFRDLTGQQFGRLTAQWPAGRTPGAVHWLCLCICGAMRIVRAQSLLRGSARSCFCLQRENRTKLIKEFTKHGHARLHAHSPEFRTWRGMIQRCTNPQRQSFKYYGGRGIKVCERWQKFENFLADMGLRPTATHSIDRFPNNDGNYEPGNCRWATRSEQQLNKRPFSEQHRANIGKAMQGNRNAKKGGI